MSDSEAQRFPISIKAVVPIGSKVVLLRNERDEWELPGGKLEKGESIEECLVREIQEELSLAVQITGPLNNWIYFVNNIHIVIITYATRCCDPASLPMLSNEHKELGVFSASEIQDLNMPEGYKRSIGLWFGGYSTD